MVNYTAGNVRPIMMSDIGTSLVICNIGDERATVLLSDVPNLQRLVYDVTVAATECTVQPDTSTFCARGGHKCRCMEAPLCGEGTRVLKY